MILLTVESPNSRLPHGIDLDFSFTLELMVRVRAQDLSFTHVITLLAHSTLITVPSWLQRIVYIVACFDPQAMQFKPSYHLLALLQHFVREQVANE